MDQTTTILLKEYDKKRRLSYKEWSSSKLAAKLVITEKSRDRYRAESITMFNKYISLKDTSTEEIWDLKETISLLRSELHLCRCSNDRLRKSYFSESNEKDVIRNQLDALSKAHTVKRFMKKSPTTNNTKKISQRKTYLIKEENTSFYKIGKSINPEQREKTLQRERPNISVIKIWDKNIEKRLHSDYKDYRVRGEWFDLTKIQVKYICTSY